MPQSFSWLDVREVGESIFGRRWEKKLAWELHVTEVTVDGWIRGAPVPDLRKQLADICRRRVDVYPVLADIARKLEKLGPPE
jgi:hypothetical protein